jgi:hypothetical protein
MIKRAPSLTSSDSDSRGFIPMGGHRTHKKRARRGARRTAPRLRAGTGRGRIGVVRKANALVDAETETGRGRIGVVRKANALVDAVAAG